MTLLEIPVPDPRNPSSIRSLPGLRMSAITESVDLVEHFEGSETRLSTIQENIEKAIKHYETNRETFNRVMPVIRRPEFERLGERAPRLMCLADVSMCATCWKGFGAFQEIWLTLDFLIFVTSF